MRQADRYVEKTRTWKDNWNNVVRRVFFRDEELKRLMCIPPDCKITQFIEKYFIEDQSSGEIITNEAVRVICMDAEGSGFYNSHVR